MRRKAGTARLVRMAGKRPADWSIPGDRLFFALADAGLLFKALILITFQPLTIFVYGRKDYDRREEHGRKS
jgi:hypothetical protein